MVQPLKFLYIGLTVKFTLQNVKGLVERYTGEQVEMTKKPASAKSTPQTVDKGKSLTKSASDGKVPVTKSAVQVQETRVGAKDTNEKGKQRNKSEEQNKDQNRSKQDKNDRRGMDDIFF